MARKKNKLASILHIKEHTEGTSNEISFSVLDAYSKQANGGKERSHTFWPEPGTSANRSRSRGGKKDVSRETSNASYDPEQEIARRKRNRRIRRVLSGVAGTFLLIAVAIGVGWYVLKDHQGQVDTRTMLVDSVANIAETDHDILALDDLLKQSVNETTVDQMKTLQESIPAAVKKLDHAAQEASPLVERFHANKDKEAAGQAVNAATARKEMFEQGTRIMNEAMSTYELAAQLDEAWNSVLNADTMARTAAELVEKTTDENVQNATQQTNEALAELNDAAAAFQEAQQQKADIDVQPYLDYIAVRTEALQYALLSNDAILVQDRQTAEENNRLYNEKDAEAATLAARLPESPTEQLYAQYDDVTAGLFDAYNGARETASSADSFLRGYLGEVGE